MDCEMTKPKKIPDDVLDQLAKFKADRISGLTSPKHPQKTVAEALAIPAPRLRNWLTRSELDLDSDLHRSAHKWRQFSDLDLVRLYVANLLSEVGAPMAVCRDVSEAMADCVKAEIAHVGAPLPERVLVLTGHEGEWRKFPIMTEAEFTDHFQAMPPLIIVIRVSVVMRFAFGAIGMEAFVRDNDKHSEADAMDEMLNEITSPIGERRRAASQ